MEENHLHCRMDAGDAAGLDRKVALITGITGKQFISSNLVSAFGSLSMNFVQLN